MQKKHLFNLSCFLLISITFISFSGYAVQDQNMDSDTEKKISKPNCGKCTGILRMYVRYGELTKTVPKLKVFLEQRIAGQKEWVIFK